MSRPILNVLALISAIVLAGCRQSDGEMPLRTAEVEQRLEDLGRDIDNVAGGNPDGPVELTDDLVVFTEDPDAISAVRALSNVVCPLLVKRSLDADTRSRLATLLWTTVAARELSERQIDRLKDDMRDLLMSIGVAHADANLAAGWVDNVQKAVTLRSRRWYERY